MQAAKLVFQQLSQANYQNRNGHASTDGKKSMDRQDFHALVMKAVKNSTEKAAGEADLEIACRQARLPLVLIANR